MSESRLTSGEAIKRKTQKRENSPKPPTHRKPDKPTKQKLGHANKPNQNHEGGSQNTNQDNGQRGRQIRPTKARARGKEGKRRPANKERADARAGSRGRREKQHKPYSFSGVLRDTGSPKGEYRWRGQSSTQGRSLCCHEAEGRNEPKIKN